MKVPYPLYVNTQRKKIAFKIFRFVTWTPLYIVEEITFESLTDAILACNYKDIINPALLSNKYEIYLAVTGITVDKIGVDYYEITPDKSFTSDLGVD